MNPTRQDSMPTAAPTPGTKNPVQAVYDAITRAAQYLNRSVVHVFECAQRRSRAAFDAHSEAAKFRDGRPGYVIPPAVVEFALWMVDQTTEALKAYFDDLLDRASGSRLAYP